MAMMAVSFRMASKRCAASAVSQVALARYTRDMSSVVATMEVPHQKLFVHREMANLFRQAEPTVVCGDSSNSKGSLTAVDALITSSTSCASSSSSRSNCSKLSQLVRQPRLALDSPCSHLYLPSSTSQLDFGFPEEAATGIECKGRRTKGSWGHRRDRGGMKGRRR
eukprot:TRINITY_DN28140_c0_g1_i1.p1 TRINITY_DN28140_c0_g1~~TRINITY_DN28140_c0_g1_i1.p1  ORF type:complete len:166 (+),score=20.96 TRINITY_DN28140_c0_g1_i1:60-557(+)